MTDIHTINSVAVVGAGTMGQGIVQVCAAAGFRALLFDVDAQQLEKGLSSIRNDLKTAQEKGKLSHDERKQVEDKIIVCRSIDEVKGDLIIEAIVEKLEVKQELFRKLERINDSNSLFATNTSSLSVTQIASAIIDPGRCVGVHFFNPAHLMKLVEVVAGAKTRPEVMAVVCGFVKKLGKTVVVVKDSPGFIVNRVARHYYLESLSLLQENVSDEAGIDKLMRSAGFKMGPFELMDLIGIDTNFFVTTSLYKAFGEIVRFKPSPIQEAKVLAGHLGRKTGKGFYDYKKN